MWPTLLTALRHPDGASSEGELERDLIVAIFDAEEPPYFQTGSMGSRRFYEDQLDGRPIHAAIIMDLVGHDVSVHSSLLEYVPQVGGILSKIPGMPPRQERRNNAHERAMRQSTAPQMSDARGTPLQTRMDSA